MFQYKCSYINTKGKGCNKCIYSQRVENPYSCNFGGYSSFEVNKNHINKDIFCKRHLNRTL